jgi:hypothetical protein
MSERFFYVRERKIRKVKQLVGEKLSKTKTSIDVERKRKTAYKIIKNNGAK